MPSENALQCRLDVEPDPLTAYKPRKPRNYRPKIGLIGCGGISELHLTAYTNQGYEVVALCDIDEAAANKRRRAFYPEATVYTDHRELLADKRIDVVDLATHPKVRGPQIKDTLEAGKHVLSQKPFVLDLDYGRELVDLAADKGCAFAVNQNGRWSPHFSFLRQLIKAGALGKISSVSMPLAWDHSWIQGLAFERIHHIILYDFAIHWFDMLACIFGEQAESVFARTHVVDGQPVKPPLAASAIAAFPAGLATLSFNGYSRMTNREEATVVGDRATFRATGPVTQANDVAVETADGVYRPKLEGVWMPDGMAGAMGELLCSIEEGREPENAARNNLTGLELCFAAIESANRGQPLKPGDVTTVGSDCVPES